MFSKDTIKLDHQLRERSRLAAEKAGYSSLEEFVAHCIEKELARLEDASDADLVTKQLRGLGYLE